MEKASWRKGSRFTKIDLIAYAGWNPSEKKRVKLTADLLLDKARDGSNVLHSAFDWNDSKAGHMYRKQQAMQMIKSIEIVVEELPSRRKKPSSIGTSSRKKKRHLLKLMFQKKRLWQIQSREPNGS